MKLTNTAIYAITAMATIVTAVPSLVVGGENFFLFNGEESVMVETDSFAANTTNILQVLAEGDVDCKGSAFCERLGSSCDDAYRKVIPSNTYTTNYDGTCGLFVSGSHCTVIGQDLMDAYNDIRNRGHCSHCGRKHIADGCMIKIDRVTGC
ncbi:hypothetical protein P175DRAFT_0445847 [Aspergillus ochraceoroseus IBT 24754]|uniref:Uncharacterized protein n=1 Tax=Aspergillus ochraceoroseus IBT 24754 TaxID=1392256 RepID=A0A2T5LM95_9EURO|nr:uncharacterized protein P175DRAFT_0445847 [Aspergillus ochraceoroseus IBT 24754]PTU17406.1 hypothetical protein P175DRAFT_0445847 [Aspergillus ochraceoroseus IBT 24754]